MIIRVCVALILMAASGQCLAGPPPGFLPLVNGQDLAGWWGLGTEDPRVWMALSADDLAAKRAASLNDINAHWRIEGDELINDGEGLFLTTDKHYADFELLLEYRTVELADSGIYLRGCPQVQIWDSREEGGKWNIGAGMGSGGLWNNSAGTAGKDPIVLADKPFGEWNNVRIRMIGERVSVWLNDMLVVNHARMENYFDRSRPVPSSGPIQLQTHGGEIRWRNVFVREIEPDEANRILRAREGEGFTTVFNGRDFEGWQGATDGYEIVDHALLCKAGSGGDLFTAEEYANFTVNLEIKLPPGGNNGLAIRYPGEGNAAYDGMCELQVLDSEDPKYANLDARQYHASVYGQAPAHRGYLREPGEWNFQEVTVAGSRITVELNGTRILDQDISEITDFLQSEDRHPGRDRTSGFFGFAGHGDPVEFRSIRIKRLD